MDHVELTTATPENSENSSLLQDFMSSTTSILEVVKENPVESAITAGVLTLGVIASRGKVLSKFGRTGTNNGTSSLGKSLDDSTSAISKKPWDNPATIRGAMSYADATPISPLIRSSRNPLQPYRQEGYRHIGTKFDPPTHVENNIIGTGRFGSKETAQKIGELSKQAKTGPFDPRILSNAVKRTLHKLGYRIDNFGGTQGLSSLKVPNLGSPLERYNQMGYRPVPVRAKNSRL